MQVSVVIPTLNEAESLPRVLAELVQQAVDEIIVVDGGSHDGTPELAAVAGACVVREARRGYGQACASGAASASGDILVYLDADGADNPANLPELLAPLLAGRADLVLGSRLAGKVLPGAMPWHQHFGNWLSSGLFRLLYDLPLTDLSPFRALYRLRLPELDMHEMTFGWPTEMIAKAARRSWRIIEVPVVYRPRYAGRSKISGTLRGTLLATYFIVSIILRYAAR